MKFLMTPKNVRVLPGAALCAASGALGMIVLSGCGGSKAQSATAGDEAASSQSKTLVASAMPRAVSSGEQAAQGAPPSPSSEQKALQGSSDALGAQASGSGGSTEVPAWAYGKVIHQVPVKAGDKVFALTFDDGPWPGSTRQILRILKDNDVKATFYMIGEQVARSPSIVREVLAAGHVIGNHSWDHPSRPRDPVMQVQRTNAQLKKVIGFTPTTFRPPYGIVAGMAREAEREGDPVLIWSADSVDWSRPGTEKIVSRILSQATPGGISLMHDGGGNRSQSVAALPLIIQGLKARGYTLVTIPELLQHRDAAAAAQSSRPKPRASTRTRSGKSRRKGRRRR